MRRRQFITLVGNAALAWPLAARAQQAAMPVVALISGRSREAAVGLAAEFRKGLSQTGRTDGRNVVVEDHWLEGHYERIPALIDDIVRRNVAVIATPANSPATLAAKAATSTIPIVFGVGEDPVELGLVASLAKPGGNATGINFFASEIDAKRLGLMHEMLPKANRFAVLINPANGTTAGATSKALEQAARVIGLELVFFAPALRLRLTRPLRRSGGNAQMRSSSPPMPILPPAPRSWAPWRCAIEYRRALFRAKTSKSGC